MDAQTTQLSGLADSFGQAFTSLLGWALAWWVGGEDPGLATLRENAEAIRPVTAWVTAAVLACSLVASAVVVMVRRRGSDLAALTLGLARSALVASGGWLVLASSWSLSDGLARWLVGGRPQTATFTSSVSAALTELDPPLALTLSIVGIASCLGFVAMVLARFVIAVVLSVGLPAMAALSVLRSVGSVRLAVAWITAVIVFKPVNAIVYRVGHSLLSNARDPVLVLLIAALSFLLAAALLPAMARMFGGIHPLTGSR